MKDVLEALQGIRSGIDEVKATQTAQQVSLESVNTELSGLTDRVITLEKKPSRSHDWSPRVRG